MNRRVVRALWWLGAATAAVLVVLELFGSEFFSYEGEAQPLWSLLRLARGESYQGNRLDLPVYYNPYFPYFFWLVQPLVSLLHPVSVPAVVMLGRGTAIVAFGLLVGLAARFGLRVLVTGFSATSFLAIVAALVMEFPERVFVFKPDSFSFLAEFAGLYLFAVYLQTRRRSRLWGSALALSAAMALKLNTIGVAVGIALYLVKRKDLRTLASFTLLVVLSGAALVWFADRLAGDALSIAWHATFERHPIALRDAVDIARGVGMGFVLFNLPLWMLGFLGLDEIRKSKPELAALIGSAMAGSFSVATLGQFAPGAWYNYYSGLLIIAAIPASIGLKPALGHPVLRSGLAVWLAVVLVHLLTALAVAANATRNYPYRAALAYLDVTYPNQMVFSNDDSALLHLNERVMTAPWADAYLEQVDAFSVDLPELEARMKARGGFAAALIPGVDCEKWTPVGPFRSTTAGLIRLEARFRDVCVFGWALPGQESK